MNNKEMEKLKNLTDLDFILRLGTKLKKIRIGQELTQIQLADLSGLGLKTISNIEVGKPFSLVVLFQVLKALDHLEMLNDLLGDTIQNNVSTNKEKRRVKFKKEIPPISTQAFWDVNFTKLNFKKNARYIILKVIERGSHEDLIMIMKYYGKSKLKRELTSAPHLSRKTLYFSSLLLDIKLNEFECYNTNQYQGMFSI